MGNSPRCLEFAILSAARTSEALTAQWTEFDRQARTWTIPAAKMKCRERHVVYLNGLPPLHRRECVRRDERVLSLRRSRRGSRAETQRPHHARLLGGGAADRRMPGPRSGGRGVPREFRGARLHELAHARRRTARQPREIVRHAVVAALLMQARHRGEVGQQMRWNTGLAQLAGPGSTGTSR